MGLKELGISWSWVNGIIAGVQEIERTRGGVTVLMNDKRHTGVIEFECVSSRIL